MQKRYPQISPRSTRLSLPQDFTRGANSPPPPPSYTQYSAGLTTVEYFIPSVQICGTECTYTKELCQTRSWGVSLTSAVIRGRIMRINSLQFLRRVGSAANFHPRGDVLIIQARAKNGSGWKEIGLGRSKLKFRNRGSCIFVCIEGIVNGDVFRNFATRVELDLWKAREGISCSRAQFEYFRVWRRGDRICREFAYHDFLPIFR